MIFDSSASLLVVFYYCLSSNFNEILTYPFQIADVPNGLANLRLKLLVEYAALVDLSACDSADAASKIKKQSKFAGIL